jgi:hypothetical protein
MALVPVTLSGDFNLSEGTTNPANFTLIVTYQGGITTQTGFNAVSDTATIQTYLESLITGIGGGTITTSSVTYAAPILSVNITGTADNEAVNLPASVFTPAAQSEPTASVITIYWGQNCPACPECPPSVNPEDATDCLSCYQQEADFCETPITILGLSDNTNYTLNILDSQSGKTYTYSVTTDGNGEADIDTGDFPTGLFSPYNSPFTITIKDTNGNPVVLTYGYVNYSCIDLTIINSYSA